MKSSAASVKEQVTYLTKPLESIATTIKGMDDQLAFMIEQIKSLSGNNQTLASEHQNLAIQEVGEISTKVVEERL